MKRACNDHQERQAPVPVMITSETPRIYRDTLNIVPAMYLRDAYDSCGNCFGDVEPCARCATPFKHRKFAFLTFPSRECRAPKLFVHLVWNQNTHGDLTSKPIQYCVIVQGYSAILNQLRVICNPNAVFMGQEFDEPHRMRRINASRVFQSSYDRYTKLELPLAMAQNDYDVGRIMVVRVMQRIICEGLCAIRATSYEHFKILYNEARATFCIDDDLKYVTTQEHEQLRQQTDGTTSVHVDGMVAGSD